MKKVILTVCAVLLSISLIQAQEHTEEKGEIVKPEKLNFRLKDGAKPDIYVDGKKFDFPMDLLDTDRIESVNVIKGDKAIKEYNSKNGVVLVTTKKITTEKAISKIKFKGDGVNNKMPILIINGKKSDKDMLEKISPDDIESIEVFKNEQALKKYNAPNGVIVVTTKKEKKK
ncbi:hypothetical protein [Flavivirga algicola]|uniref:TonB-dependent receptor plug domain-containing protein n=1 Tax=Flavivirga algicola TaxID=2729136 RepID=A0ABX1S4M9_9FLAO|nr:hypothetical protein [Flavivirga algicola]NMH89617.1 hypothetical protein [Flavivirga algicola]